MLRALEDPAEAARVGERARALAESKYSDDARARMAYIVNSLAEYEVHVARYYFTRGAYVAAANRAQAALTEYQNVPASEEALSILARSYDALNLKPLADDARRILQANYPNSAYLAGNTPPIRMQKEPWWKFW